MSVNITIVTRSTNPVSHGGFKPTLVFDLEVGGDQRWGLTSDPCGERLGGLDLVILYYLDLKKKEGWGQNNSYMFTAQTHTCEVTMHCPPESHKVEKEEH